MCEEKEKKLSIDDLNEIYFGIYSEKNKEYRKLRDYALQDFDRALKAIIYHELVNQTFRNKILDENRDISLIEMMQIYDYGLIVALRKVIKPEYNKRFSKEKQPGSCTCGDLMKDLMNLSEDDLYEYFGCKDVFTCVGDFVTKKDMKQMIAEIKNSAKRFNSQGYYDKLVKKNEEIMLHKNKEPTKRCLVRAERLNNSPYSPVIKTYRPQSEVNTISIVQCIEELAEILLDYKNMLLGQKDFPIKNQPCSFMEYISATLQNLGVDDREFAVKVTELLKKHLKNSLALLRWQ